MSLGNCVELRNISEEETYLVYLPKKELYLEQTITTDRGKETIKKPITKMGDYQVLSPKTPLAEAIFGKHEGEQFVLNGIGYKILKIFNDDELVD